LERSRCRGAAVVFLHVLGFVRLRSRHKEAHGRNADCAVSAHRLRSLFAHLLFAPMDVDSSPDWVIPAPLNCRQSRCGGDRRCGPAAALARAQSCKSERRSAWFLCSGDSSWPRRASSFVMAEDGLLPVATCRVIADRTPAVATVVTAVIRRRTQRGPSDQYARANGFRSGFLAHSSRSPLAVLRWRRKYPQALRPCPALPRCPQFPSVQSWCAATWPQVCGPRLGGALACGFCWGLPSTGCTARDRADARAWCLPATLRRGT